MGKAYANRKPESLRPANDLYLFKHLFFDKEKRRYKRICGIYKIENEINHKVYIGQSKDIYARFVRHVSSKFSKNDLYKDFKKFGLNNFSFEILKETYDLDYWEIFLIRIYKSANPKFGYNLTVGGHELNGELNPFYGKHHSKITNEINAQKHFCKRIRCIETGEIFNYAREVQKKYGFCHSHITRCCKGMSNSCGGLHWEYADEKVDKSTEVKKPNRYYWLCRDPLKNDICRYYILQNRIRRHREEYKSVVIGNCILEEQK